MAQKLVPFRTDEATAAQLKFRASIEDRSVNDIIGDAIREYSKSHPVPREKMLELVRGVAQDDAALLKALADA